jgi:mannose-6-phosphate isomerase-like protein (cupin superfamily)
MPIETGLKNVANRRGLRTCSLVSTAAGQGWTLELYELAEPIPAHCHKRRKQLTIVAEGELTVVHGADSHLLRAGQLKIIEPGELHALIPHTATRFLAIDLPGAFPADFLPALSADPFGRRLDRGSYAIYELLPGVETGGKWSVALLEIQDSPRHFHRIEKEIFVVVAGRLEIELGDTRQQMGPAGAVEVDPERVHRLRSVGDQPVRVLCFNFPAFDPADLHILTD